MNSARWQQIRSLFDEAVELDTAEREKYLSAVTDKDILAEVRKMFAADNESLIQHSPFSDLSTDGGNRVPEKIGRYKIVREIGRGGMGAVYEAVRDDGEFSQRAAVKIIKRGMDSDEIVRRFRNERQILAELQHPNIARLFDGGVSSEGSPFYVMEFIEGLPIDNYCRENNSAVTEKLALFRQVCSAVSYAHSQLIVHRDLKPSNILITKDKNVKLLDFGIAKVLNSDSQESPGTATQLGMMTPAYASPEQIRGEKVTTVSDVYSLGVVLYELLAGERPYRTEGKSYPELLELVARTQPRKPSETASAALVKTNQAKCKNSNLKGDLDNIVLKALQKDPARRYHSVEQFSEDIRRYLDGQPVSARPDTFSYRLSKFVGRNKVPAIAGLLVFLSLCAGITVALWQTWRAEWQRTLAEHRFTEVRELANSVIFKYHDAIAALPGSTSVRELLVTDATKYLDNLANDSGSDPALQRELALAYIKLGDVRGKAYAANIGDTAGAVDSYRKAAALLEKAVAADKNNNELKFDLIKGYEALFQIYMRTGDPGRGPTLEKALALQDQLLAADPANVSYKLQKTSLLVLSGDTAAGFESKIPIFENALAVSSELLAAAPDDKDAVRTNMRINQRLGTTYNWLGDAAAKKDDKPKASQYYALGLPFNEKSLEMAGKLIGAEPNNISYQRNFAMGSINLAESFAKTGKRGEAMEMIGQCLKTLARMESEDKSNREIQSDIAFSHEAIANIWQWLGDTEKQIDESEKALAIQENIYKDDSFNAEIQSAVIKNHHALETLYRQKGNEEKAAIHRSSWQELSALKQSQSGKKSEP
jgi:serine/threonine protein kinase